MPEAATAGTELSRRAGRNLRALTPQEARSLVQKKATYSAVQPPSTSSDEPVTMPAAEEHR